MILQEAFTKVEIFKNINTSTLEMLKVYGKLIKVPKDKLLAVMEQDFQLTKAILDSMALKIRRLYRQLKNTSGSIRLDKKIAEKLWKLSTDYGVPCKEGICIDIFLT